MVLTPIMRKSVTCFGDDTCYALGFGFPAVLMLLSLSIFFILTNYKFVYLCLFFFDSLIRFGKKLVQIEETQRERDAEVSPLYNSNCITYKVRWVLFWYLNCFQYAIGMKCKRRNGCLKRNHWLDHAKGKYQMKLIYDMKIVFAVLLLYTPLPIFWSLFDQQGSRWTFQVIFYT